MTALTDGVQRLGRLVSDMVSGAVGELRTNPRARTGLVAIVVVMCVAGALRGWSYVEAREAEISALRSNEENLLSLTSDVQSRAWSAADADAKKLLEAAKQRLWSNGPVGASHADFYAWLQQSANTAGLQGAQIRLGQARRIGVDGQLTEMSVSMFVPSAPTPPPRQAIYAFLKELNSSSKRIHTRSLRVKFEPVTLFEGEFVAYVATNAVKEGQQANAK